MIKQIFCSISQLLLLFAFFQLTSLPDMLISEVWASEGLPSQKARFQGMGATLKEQKKQTFFSSDESKDEDTAVSDKTTIDDSSSYFKLHTFVLNIRDKRYPGQLIFLTLDIFCELKNPDDRWLIDSHMPAIKDWVITYVSGLYRQQLQSQKKKKQLQQNLTRDIQTLLLRLTGKKVITNLYLTRILIQP